MQGSDQQPTIYMARGIDPPQPLASQSRQYPRNVSFIAPPSRHGLLQPSQEKSKNPTEMTTTVPPGFLWRRNGSELDLEGKLSQELEVGYTWLPPAPLKPVSVVDLVSLLMPYNLKLQAPTHTTNAHQHPHPYIRSSMPAPTKVHTQQPISSTTGKPRIIEVQHKEDDSPSQADPSTNAIDDRNNSVYFADGKRRIDFVLVYEQGVRLKPVDAHRVGRSFVEKEKLRQFFQENLHKDGLDLEEEVHKEENNAQITVFVKVHGTWPALCRQAEILKIKMPLRLRDTFSEEMDDGNPSFPWKLFRKTFGLLMKYVGWENDGNGGSGGSKSSNEGNVVTWAFQRKKIDKYAINDQETFFTPTQRMEMVWEILQKARNDPGDEKKRGIEQLLELGVYDSAFPLHDGVAGGSKGVPITEWCDRQKLRRSWATWRCMFKRQPLELIRR